MDNKSILEELHGIKQYLLLGTKTALNMVDAALYTGLSKSRLYTLVCNKRIPHYKKGKYTYFEKSELEKWLLECRVPTNEDIEEEATERASRRFLQDRKF